MLGHFTLQCYNIHSQITKSQDLLDDPGNVTYTTLFLDIDGSLENYKSILEVVDLIVNFLEKHKLCYSVYILWGSESAYVRISSPLVVAHSVVEFILREIRERLGVIHEPLVWG